MDSDIQPNLEYNKKYADELFNLISKEDKNKISKREVYNSISEYSDIEYLLDVQKEALLRLFEYFYDSIKKANPEYITRHEWQNYILGMTTTKMENHTAIRDGQVDAGERLSIEQLFMKEHKYIRKQFRKIKKYIRKTCKRRRRRSSRKSIADERQKEYTRFANACRGLTKEESGMNISELKDRLEEMNPNEKSYIRKAKRSQLYRYCPACE